MPPVEAYIKKKFAEYYEAFSWRIEGPAEIEKREFGFILFKEKIMVRHRSFKNVEVLRSFIKTVVPSDAYYSSAYYLRPEEDMKGKGWLGAELIFDIDADHIDTPCKEEHDYWMCIKCGRSGMGLAPEACPKCGEGKIQGETWICRSCLERAKEETLKLVRFLMEDFGFDANDVSVYFTGHRGYHVHINAKEILDLGSEERKEIIDYVMGNGIDLSLIEQGGRHGWGKRVALAMEEFNSSQGALRRGRGVKKKAKFVKAFVKEKSVNIDAVVTMDLHRLIRLPETLNSKTGLRVVKVELSKLREFDPFSEALAVTNGEEEIRVIKAPKFSLGGREFGPYEEGRVVHLPMAAALFLMCKGKAEPVEERVRKLV
ncbi:TPA: hypothetical protein EYP26_00830 [Candidatus Bathyarchaeota archaeon]|nr:hypothetical protein [Candidatus Bathyarchaeota archaeon]